MTPLIMALVVGVILHTLVGIITRTPEDDQTPLHWQAWLTFLVGLTSTAAIVVIAVGSRLAAGFMLPFWALILAADLLTLAWKLWKHRQRVAERRSLQSLFDRPSHGEA
ncbi:hypothetical protein [Streptomyces prasinopilosus]|uniref:hypothetical protein n=1 Tax=Streptomyces prasinopilosus TaxID=67344 RepID=UPI0006EB91AC|nr:hypothetical protein [Streptomyces prasinopilosus]